MDHLSHRGIVRGAASKLPGLAQLRQRFDGHRRVAVLASRVAPERVTDEFAHAVVDSVGVAVEGPVDRPDRTGRRDASWQADGPGRWVWHMDPRHVLTDEVTGVAGRADGAWRRRVVLTRDGSETDRRALATILDGGTSRTGHHRDIRPVAPSVGTADLADVAAAAAAVCGRPLLAVTGAGLSAASGILPFFGPESLDGELGLFEPFPGRLVDRLLHDPVGVTDLLARWHLAFLAAEPTPAHRALADLERRGHLAGTLTTNLDRLHHATGARRVAESAALTRARPPEAAGVLVVGCANDPGGVIARARAAGASVVAVDRTIPSWARASDLVVLGDPQVTVPDLAAALTGLRSPLTGPGNGWITGTALAAIPPNRLVAPPVRPWAELPEIADRLRDRVALRRSRLHGPRHWLTVAWIGAALAAEDRVVDPLVVALFALFHDCARTHDGHDPEHGRRGAAVALELLAEAPWITMEQLGLLEVACADHTAGRTSADPTVGACWDADRLDLWRVGVTPSEEFLSRPFAPGLRDWSRRFTEVGDDEAAWDDWRPVSATYRALASGS